MEVASKAFVAGELAFDGMNRTHYLDITDVIKNHPSNKYTFVLVRETRELGDDLDKGKTITISSKENKDAPQIILWK